MPFVKRIEFIGLGTRADWCSVLCAKGANIGNYRDTETGLFTSDTEQWAATTPLSEFNSYVEFSDAVWPDGDYIPSGKDADGDIVGNDEMTIKDDAEVGPASAASVTLTDEQLSAIAAQITSSFSPVTLPVMNSRLVTSPTAVQMNDIIEIVHGSSAILPFNFGNDYSGWTIVNGAKRMPYDTVRALGPDPGWWLDAAHGQGYVILNPGKTAPVGSYADEITLFKDAEVYPAMRFTLRVVAGINS